MIQSTTTTTKYIVDNSYSLVVSPNGRARARNYTLGSAITMVISLMCNHTMPIKSPKSWSGKWTQNFIGAFSLVFIALYTAQMASILSAGPDPLVFKGVNDPKLVSMRRGYLATSSARHHLCSKSTLIHKSDCLNATSLYSTDNEAIRAIL